MSSYHFAIVCEALADKRQACELADRVLRERIERAQDNLEAIRRYCGENDSEECIRWASVKDRARARGVRAHGHFSGEPGEPDAANARRALLLLAAQDAANVPDAVILIRDSDGDPRRRTGLCQARDEKEWAFPIVIGVADPKRECWSLVGHENLLPGEAGRVEEIRKELGFDPVAEAHRLDASKHGAKNDAKRVAQKLWQGDKDREARCWQETDLDRLKRLGVQVGLAAYLEEVEQRLVPVVSGAPPPNTAE